jgi:hypothetical protein
MTFVRSFTQKHAQAGTILLSLLLSILIVSCSRKNPTGNSSHTPPYFCSDSSSLSTSLRALTLYSDSLCVQSDNEDSLTYSFLDSVDGITISDAVISWTPMENDTGRKTISLRVSDKQGGSDTVCWVITVFPANHSPVFNTTHHPDTLAFTGISYHDTLFSVDPDGDSLGFSLVEGPSRLAIAGHIVTWTPSDSDTGVTRISVQVSDNYGGHETQSWLVTVKHTLVNHPPVFLTVDSEMTTIAYINHQYHDTVRATDPDHDTIAFSMPYPIPGMSINDSVIIWTPQRSDYGQKTVMLRAADGKGGFDSLKWTITITNLTSLFLTTSSDMKSSVVVGSECQDTIRYLGNDTLIISFLDSLPGMRLLNNVFAWTPGPTDLGDQFIRVVLHDNSKSYDTLSWGVKVLSFKSGIHFTATPADVTITADTPYKQVLSVTTVAGVKTLFDIKDPLSGMSLIDTVFQWTPANQDAGRTTVKIIARDSLGGADSVQWHIIVLPVNHPPIFVSIPASMHDTAYAGVPFIDTVSATDPDNDPLTFTILSGFNGMTMSDSTIVWTPQDSDTTTTKEIKIMVSDGNNGTDTLSWNLLVLPDPNGGAGLGKKSPRPLRKTR